jgi:hypothetical protein
MSDPDSDQALAFFSDPGFGSGLFVENTLEFSLFFLKAKRILNLYFLHCRSSKLGTKADFLKICIFTAFYLLVGNRA